MSGIWSAFACCFPRKRTRQEEGTGSETNSLLAHSVHESTTAPTGTANKPQSVVSYEAPQPGAGGSTTGYGAVGQGHAVLGEEGRLRVQSIASAVENRMISINHPGQSNLAPHYSQSRRPTPTKQDMPAVTSTTSSPASVAEEPVEAPPLISLPPAETSAAGAQEQDANGAGNLARPDLGRSRSSTSSSFSQSNQAQIEGVRRVNLNLGGMWERERERGKGKKGSIGSNAAGAVGTIKSNASVKSVGKKEKEDEQVVVVPPTTESSSRANAVPSPAVPTLTSKEVKPIQVEVEVETEAEPANGSGSTVVDEPVAVAVKETENENADANANANEEEPAAGTTTPGSDNKDGGNGNNGGGGGKSGRGKKKKNRGRGRGRGGKGGR